MPKLGKVKLDEQEDEVSGTLTLTAEQAKELSELLSDGSSQAEEATDEKKEGRVELVIEGRKLSLKITKVKLEKEDDDDK